MLKKEYFITLVCLTMVLVWLTTSSQGEAQAEVFGIEYVNDTTLLVYHIDQGWSASWNYVCLSGGCYPGTLVNGRYERQFGNVTLGQTYSIEFKVQDNTSGQYIVSDTATFTNTPNPTPVQTSTSTPVSNTPTSVPTNTPTNPPPATITITPSPTQPPAATPTTPPTSGADFGIEYVNNNTLRIFHVDQGWSGSWHYLCLDGYCISGSLVNGRYEREQTNVTLGQTYHVEFKVQDNVNGQYLVSDNFLFTDVPPEPTATPQPTATLDPSLPTPTPTPTTAPPAGVLVLELSERLRQRHETDPGFDSFNLGRGTYFDGTALYYIRFTDYPDHLEVYVRAPVPLTQINFTIDLKDACRGNVYCDPLQYHGGNYMHKHTPGGPQNNDPADPATEFYYNIYDMQAGHFAGMSWAQIRTSYPTMNELFTMEFTPTRFDPNGNHDQYYSTLMRYVPGQGRLQYEFDDDNYYTAENLSTLPNSDVTQHNQYGQSGYEFQKHFSQAFYGIKYDDMDQFLRGRHVFNQNLEDEVGVVGPLYTQESCGACHQAAGRGQPPSLNADDGIGFVVKVAANNDPSAPHPTYGRRWDTDAVDGTSPEGTVFITGYETIMRGGVALQKPIYSLSDGSITNFGARIAPQIPGLGLLEAVEPATIEGFAAAQSSDPNISGRVNYVPSPSTGQLEVGRFGWKAGNAFLIDQAADALLHDMGVTSPLFPNHDGPGGSGAELTQTDLEKLEGYLVGLGIPLRGHPNMIGYYGRNSGLFDVPQPHPLSAPQIVQGEQLFTQLGCSSCHIPEMQTGNSHPILDFRNVRIRPYTDMLLHDMGPDLADPGQGVQDGNANNSEWRTPPLWGTRYIEHVNGHSRFLHDGRAANRDEAIRWHGGEAEAARNAYMNLSQSQRDALILFLRSL